MVTEEFDRYRPAQEVIEGRVHLRHAALAERGQKLVAPTEQMLALSAKELRIPHQAYI